MINLRLKEACQKLPNLFKAILLTIVCYFVSIGLYDTFRIKFFDSLVIAPVNEELFKQYAVRAGFPFIYTFIFSMFELSIYYLKYSTEDLQFNIYFFLGRLFVVYFHFTTVFVQKYFYEKNRKIAFVGILIAIFVHCIYNISCNF